MNGGAQFMINIKKGFKIAINDTEILANVQEGVTMIILSPTLGIQVTGRDEKIGLAYNWGQLDLKMGDKLVISIVDEQVSTPPFSTKPLERDKLLAEYFDLQAFLSEKGKI